LRLFCRSVKLFFPRTGLVLFAIFVTSPLIKAPSVLLSRHPVLVAVLWSLHFCEITLCWNRPPRYHSIFLGRLSPQEFCLLMLLGLACCPSSQYLYPFPPRGRWRTSQWYVRQPRPLSFAGPLFVLFRSSRPFHMLLFLHVLFRRRKRPQETPSGHPLPLVKKAT